MTCAPTGLERGTYRLGGFPSRPEAFWLARIVNPLYLHK